MSFIRTLSLLAIICLLTACPGEEGSTENDATSDVGITDVDEDSTSGPDSGDDEPDAEIDVEDDVIEDPGTDVVLEAGITHQVARRSEEFSFVIPEGLFSDQELDISAQVLRLNMSEEVPEVLNDFWWQRDLNHHWLDFDGIEFSGTPETYEDVQTLQIEVRATALNGSEAATSFLLVVVDGEGELSAPASTESECAYVVKEGETGYVSADELGIEPGDSICVRGGATTGALNFRNIEGTAVQPIYIINVDGAAYTDGQGQSYTVTVTNSNHFRLLGAGTPEDPYGCKIQGDTGPGVQIKQCYEDIEVAFIEIHDTSFAGLSMKNDGEQRPDGDMYDIRAHDLYVHNLGTVRGTEPHTSGESVYCGIGGWEEGTHSIHRLRMHHIIGHDIAWDAIQIKNNDDEDSVVERNFFRRYGIGSAGNTGAHDEGLFAGEGSTGIFRYNWVEDAFGPSSHGIQFFGAASTLFHHNVIVNLAEGSSGGYAILGLIYMIYKKQYSLSRRQTPSLHPT